MPNGHIGIGTVGFTSLTALLIGRNTGMLCAPQSGAEPAVRLRTLLKACVKEQAGDVAEYATGAMDKMVDKGRRFVNV